MRKSIKSEYPALLQILSINFYGIDNPQEAAELEGYSNAEEFLDSFIGDMCFRKQSLLKAEIAAKKILPKIKKWEGVPYPEDNPEYAKLLKQSQKSKTGLAVIQKIVEWND